MSQWPHTEHELGGKGSSHQWSSQLVSQWNNCQYRIPLHQPHQSWRFPVVPVVARSCTSENRQKFLCVTILQPSSSTNNYTCQIHIFHQSPSSELLCNSLLSHYQLLQHTSFCRQATSSPHTKNYLECLLLFLSSKKSNSYTQLTDDNRLTCAMTDHDIL